jgi:hypothetical protein
MGICFAAANRSKVIDSVVFREAGLAGPARSVGPARHFANAGETSIIAPLLRLAVSAVNGFKAK